MSSKRQQIIDAIKTRFATITTANSYLSNVGQKVLEWQTTPIDVAADPSALPCIAMSDPKETNLGPPANGDKNSAHRTFGLEIEAMLVLAETDQTATKARAALGDVIKAIGADQKWSGLARRTEPVSDELMLDKEGTRISGVRMRFTVEYGRAPWEA